MHALNAYRVETVLHYTQVTHARVEDAYRVVCTTLHSSTRARVEEAYRVETVLHYRTSTHARVEEAYRVETVLHYNQVHMHAKGSEDAYRVKIGT